MNRTLGPRQFVALSLIVALFCVTPAVPAQWPGDGDEFSQHLSHLASDEMRGRGNDRPEIDLAADYIAYWFERYGLAPGGDNDTYFHEFEARTSVEVGPTTSLVISLDGETHHMKHQSDYVALFSGPVPALAPLAFAGFGITAPELGYDDYAGLDVQGKVVAVFQHEPEEQLESSRFSGTDSSPWFTLTYKAFNAKRHGAVGLLVLPDPGCGRERAWDQDVQVEALGIPTVKLNEEWAAKLLRAGPFRRQEINRAARNLSLVPFDIPDVTISLRVEAIERYRTLRNVVGVVHGTTDRYVVIGAHYDHLGLGQRKALSPENIGQVHNGADDNASGTAGLLHLASLFSGEKPEIGLVFIAFAAEELGLLGSSAFVARPTIPLDTIRAMINMDMIGRSDGTLFVGGVGTAVEFRDLLNRLKEKTLLNLSYAETPQAPSDHLSFSGERIPVLFFFTGLHADYHQPSDDVEKIDRVRTGEVLRLVESLLRYLVREDQPVTFVETDTNTALLGAAAGSTLLGLVVDPSWEADGILVADVKPATPAFHAGFQRGDILFGCDGKAITNRHDLITELTQPEVPSGTLHNINVLRGEELLRLMLSTAAETE